MLLLRTLHCEFAFSCFAIVIRQGVDGEQAAFKRKRRNCTTTLISARASIPRAYFLSCLPLGDHPHRGFALTMRASVLEQKEVRGRRWPHTSLPLQEDLGPRLMTTQWSHQPATLPQSSHMAGSPSSNPTKHQCSSGHTETTTHSGQAKPTEIQGGR